MAPEPSLRRILVVDDDDEIEMLATAWARTGWVDSARDGGEALAAARAAPYVVLGDLHMPRVDGPSSTRRSGRDIISRCASPRMPRVIFMTGSPAEHAEFLRAPPIRSSRKPFALRSSGRWSGAADRHA
jgi:CheY-like chemotaxis protein